MSIKRKLGFIFYDIGNGLLSNYPVCCVLYFLVRVNILNASSNKFWMKYIWPLEHRVAMQHIACPLHWARLRYGYESYYTCKNCKWQQLKKKDKCAKCDSEELSCLSVVE